VFCDPISPISVTVTHPELNVGSAIQNHGHLFSNPGEVFDPNQPHWTLSHASQVQLLPQNSPLAPAFNYIASQHLAWFYSLQKYKEISFNGTFFHHFHFHSMQINKKLAICAEQDLGLAFTFQHSLFQDTLRLGITPHFIYLLPSTLKSKKFNLNLGTTYQFAQLKQFQFYANFIIRNIFGHYLYTRPPSVSTLYYPRNYECSVSMQSPLWSSLKDLCLELGKRFHETFDFYGRNPPLSPFFFKGSFRWKFLPLQLGWTSEFIFVGTGLHFRHFQMNFLFNTSNLNLRKSQQLGLELSLAAHF